MKTSHKVLARSGAAISTLSSALIASKAFAQGQGLPLPPSSSTPGLPEETIGTTILTVITWGLGIAGTVAVLFLIVGGFLYITASGDERRLESAKTTLKNAIIGTVFILVSLVIVLTLNQILGV